MLARNNTVRVCPHSSPDQSAIGKVMMVSENGLSIAIGFEDKPPFVSLKEGFFVGPYGVLMLAMRYGSPPIGPWVELTGGGHYEIEEVQE